MVWETDEEPEGQKWHSVKIEMTAICHKHVTKRWMDAPTDGCLYEQGEIGSDQQVIDDEAS